MELRFLPVPDQTETTHLVDGDVAGGGAEGVGRGEKRELAGLGADVPADDLAVLLDRLGAGVDDVLGRVHPREGGVHHAVPPAGLNSVGVR